jgi:hypothetical protein
MPRDRLEDRLQMERRRPDRSEDVTDRGLPVECARKVIVVPLDTKERSHSREELRLVERLRDEVVRPGFERLLLLFAAACGDRDDGQERGGRIMSKRSARAFASASSPDAAPTTS